MPTLPELFITNLSVVPSAVEDAIENLLLETSYPIVQEPAAAPENSNADFVAEYRVVRLFGVVVPMPTLPAKYAFPVVVAPPEMVSPPACVPSPMVEEARKRLPPVNVLLLASSVEEAAVIVMSALPLKEVPLMLRAVARTVAAPAVKLAPVPVMLVPTSAEGVPRAGVTRVGDVARTTSPVPVQVKREEVASAAKSAVAPVTFANTVFAPP